MASVSAPQNERVMVFEDGSNMFWSSRERGFKIDHLKMVNLFVGSNRRLIRPYFYCAIGVPPILDQIKFHDSLKFNGFEVITKPLRFRKYWAKEVGTGKKVNVEKWGEKGVDVALVTDMISMAWKHAYDTVILIGGDEDYLPAIKEIKQIPKRIEIAAFSDTDSLIPPQYKTTINREMRMIADHFYPLENFRKDIERF